MTEYEKSERITPKWKIKVVQKAMDNMIRRDDIDTGLGDMTMDSKSLTAMQITKQQSAVSSSKVATNKKSSKTLQNRGKDSKMAETIANMKKKK